MVHVTRSRQEPPVRHGPVEDTNRDSVIEQSYESSGLPPQACCPNLMCSNMKPVVVSGIRPTPAQSSEEHQNLCKTLVRRCPYITCPHNHRQYDRKLIFLVIYPTHISTSPNISRSCLTSVDYLSELLCDSCQFIILHLFHLVPETVVQILPKLTGCVTFHSQPLHVAFLCVYLPTCLLSSLLELQNMR